jgi:transcriptional regulator with XRE-family HTH domain
MRTAASIAFGLRLRELRKCSRWPTTDNFSYQVGLSPSGYKKYESGDRLPTPESLSKLTDQIRASPELRHELFTLRNSAKAGQMGLTSSAFLAPRVDLEILAERIQSEVFYSLKQAGVGVEKHIQRVVKNRVALILKATLGATNE